MPVPDDNSPEYDEPGVGQWEMPSVVVSRLAVPADLDTLRTVLDERNFEERVELVRALQPHRWQARWHEWNASVHGIERDRFYEIYTCMHSSGERFGLALAAGNEVALRSRYRREIPDLDGHAAQELAHRALAELWSYYLLGTGHSLAALTLKVMALDEALRPALLDKLGVTCTIASQEPREWPSLNVNVCRALRRVARDSTHASIKTLPDAISKMVQSTAWEQLDKLRGEDYHRNRPPSGPVDAPVGSAYELDEDGNLSLSVAGAKPPSNRASQFSNLLIAVENLLAEQLEAFNTTIFNVLMELAP